MLKDIQSLKDSRNIDIDIVGIKELTYPICISDKKDIKQHSIAKVNMGVHLSHEHKGTHMSRFIEIFHNYKDNISITSIKNLLEDTTKCLNSVKSYIEISFPYFMEKQAPISKKSALIDYHCIFIGEYTKDNYDFILKVKIPVISLCPCSKEISDRGAHNQRSYISISVRFINLLWIEDLINIAEQSASGQIYALLKREDEKYITESVYDNPAFVEDMVRNTALALMEDKRVIWFSVECENMESIHSHNAWAKIERFKNITE